jgi:hypothetical protein
MAAFLVVPDSRDAKICHFPTLLCEWRVPLEK